MAKQNTIESPKIYDLADMLEMPVWAALGLMESFWDWVGKAAQDGRLNGFAKSQIADGVKWRGEPRELWHYLRSCRFVDELADGTLYVHDYHDHAPDFVRKRIERAGKKFANGLPARMPKEGYKDAGYAIPEGVKYDPKVETVARQTVVKAPKTARQRRDNGSPKPHETPPNGEQVASLVRAEDHPIPSHPRQEEIITQDLIGRTGFSDGRGSDGPDRSPPTPSSEPVAVVSASLSEPEEAPAEFGTPLGSDGVRALIEQSRKPGETDAAVRHRLMTQRKNTIRGLERADPGAVLGG